MHREVRHIFGRQYCNYFHENFDGYRGIIIFFQIFLYLHQQFQTLDSP